VWWVAYGVRGNIDGAQRGRWHICNNMAISYTSYRTCIDRAALTSL
jgi:hypothetical protein